jgi:hypothetical protein
MCDVRNRAINRTVPLRMLRTIEVQDIIQNVVMSGIVSLVRMTQELIYDCNTPKRQRFAISFSLWLPLKHLVQRWPP